MGTVLRDALASNGLLCGRQFTPARAMDESLRVRCVERPRIAYASAIPTLVGGNINAGGMIIAEKAASLVCFAW